MTKSKKCREREKRFACVCGIFCLPVLCSFIKKMLICEIIQEEADSFKGWKGCMMIE